MKRFKIVIILMSAIISSCVNNSTIKHTTYKGDDSEFPIEKIGILKCARSVKINSIDGNKKYSVASTDGPNFKGCEIKFLPGKHTVNLCYEINYSPGGGLIPGLNSTEIMECTPKDIVFIVKPGRIYAINAQITKEYTTSLNARYGVSGEAGEITIVDVTDYEKQAVYYNMVKEQSKLAINYQVNSEWGKAEKHWSKALEYAVKGEASQEQVAEIQLGFGRALAVRCKYDEALKNLNSSYKYYSEYTGPLYKPLISMANIYYETNQCDKSLKIYNDFLEKYRSRLKNNETLLRYFETNRSIIENNKKCIKKDESTKLIYKAPYGQQC